MKSLSETALLAFSNVLLAFASWIFIALLARQEGLEVVGVFGLALAIFAPIVFALAAEARLRIGSGTNESEVHELFLLRVLLQFLTLLAIILILSLFQVSSSIGGLMVAVFIMRTVESNFDFSYGKWVLNREIKRVAISQLLRAVLTVFVAFILLTTGFNATETVYAVAMCQFFLLLRSVFDIFSIYWSGDRYVRRYQNIITSLVSTFFAECRVSVYSALASLNGSIPRYLLASAGSLETVGLFTIYLQFFAAGTTVTTAVNMAYARAVGLDLTSGRRNSDGDSSTAVRGLIITTLIVGVLMLTGCTLLGPLFLDIFFDVTRADARFEISLIMFAALFAYTAAAASSVLLFLGRVKVLVYLLLGAISVLVVTYNLVGYFGYSSLLAVCLAMITSRFFLALFSVSFCQVFDFRMVKLDR